MLRKALFIFFAVLIGFSALAAPTLKIGSPPPSFTLNDLNGSSTSLDTYLSRQVVVLGFFASWSKSCQEEVAFLNGLAKNYRAKNLKVVGISYDRKATDLKQFISTNKINFTILHDKKLKTLRDFRILILPTLYVIDQQGNIKNVYVDFDKNVAAAVTQDIKNLLK